MGTALKSTFLWEDFFPTRKQFVCFGTKGPTQLCSFKWHEQFLRLAPTSKKDAPHSHTHTHTHTHTKLHILNKKHHTTKITTLSILLKLEEKKRSYVLLNFGKNFNMWLTMFNFFNKIFWLIIYIFMIKIIFNFKRNYIYALMHALHAIFLIIIWLIIYIFIIKIVFYFKYIHASAWGTC